MNTTPLLPPFTLTTALAKVRNAENAWNTRDPDRVVLAYTEDCAWRNRSEFLEGRAAIRAFLSTKWQRELDYRLVKSLWTFDERRIAVRFQYEWHDADERWHRSYGNELWDFADDGRMRRREASINDVEITAAERRFTWLAPGPRPADGPEIDAVR
jgi:nuclear transport factor 2 (NTF2) superfamily protein